MAAMAEWSAARGAAQGDAPGMAVLAAAAAARPLAATDATDATDGAAGGGGGGGDGGGAAAGAAGGDGGDACVLAVATPVVAAAAVAWGTTHTATVLGPATAPDAAIPQPPPPIMPLAQRPRHKRLQPGLPKFKARPKGAGTPATGGGGVKRKRRVQ